MKQMRKSLIVLLGILVLALTLAACAGNNEPAATPVPATPAPTPEPTPTPTPDPPAEVEVVRTRPETDREGYPITLPDEINTIVTLGPSNAEILVALGFGDKIIAADRFAADVDGLGDGVPRDFGIRDFDVEYITDLMPDVIFVTGMTRAGGEDDPMAPFSAVGITVIYMPSSVSIAAIMEDIRFMADVMQAGEAGEAIIANMQAEIAAIREIAAGITEIRTVYFEISPAPWMVSFGTGTFLHEMIELIGAVNIFADEEGWVSISEEILLELNPDVILTSVDFLDDPIADITDRPGFNTLTAVQEEAIFIIDTAASNRPSQNIVIALRQMAEAVFPEYFR